MRVLICDDEPDVRLLFRTAFEHEGVEVIEAGDGDACIEQAVAHAPDMIILDLHMPRRDGLSALPELHRLCPGARILVVSAHGAAAVWEKSRARGAWACFDKPNFLARIPRLVERYSVA